MAGGLEALDTVEPLANRVERHAFDRLIMLADGVFAIAVTLSALEIRAPTDMSGGPGAILARMTLPLGIYALSFAVVAVFWASNRRAMSRVARVDAVFTGLALAFLAAVALVPAGNRFLVEAGGGAAWSAALVYLGLIGVLSVLQAAMWAYAAYGADLLLPEVTPRFRLVNLVLGLVTPPVAFVLAIALASLPGVRGLVLFAGGFAALFAVRRVLTRWAER